MFLRRFERRKAGKRHTYWALVESYRTEQGSRQRVVAYLGELKRSEQDGWAQLGRRLNKEDRPQPSLFDPPVYDEPRDGEPVLVKLDGVRMERLRDFGEVWLALGLWRLLGLDSLLSELMPPGREDVPWPVVAAILTIARFCEPSSELHIEETWYRRTALDDLVGVSPELVNKDRLYVGLDRLLECKESLERHLKDRLGNLFDLSYDLLLYDITSTYFEGECGGSELARRGYSRDSRPDCLQVCIGLVVTGEGLPLGYEVFSGNTADSTTIETIVGAMEKKYGRAQRVWVMDRGMVSEDNLSFLRARGNSYIVGTPKAMLRRFEEHLTREEWHVVREGVEVKLVPGPEGEETFVLARSADRREKERAMHERFIERLESGLKKLQASAQSGRLKDPAVANRRLGRLLERQWRAAGAFDVVIEPIAAPQGKAKLSVQWSRNRSWGEWASLSEGCYLLRTNLKETDPAVLWKRYTQLTEVESAFRITKEELKIRPVYHQLDRRIEAHILVCFLAYVLWKTLGQWMKGSQLGDAPRTLIEELARIKSGDVVLPTQHRNGGMGPTVRLRCVMTPDKPQQVLLQRLGLKLPTRLRRIDELPPL